MNVVIIGAGQSGALVAHYLRERNFVGHITLLGDEELAPYERPPLSKHQLFDDSAEPNYILDVSKAAEIRVDMQLGVSAVSVNRSNKAVYCSNGQVVFYDRLVFATGGRPRRLFSNKSDSPTPHYLRTWVDLISLRSSLKTTQTLVIVGGGWIGLELASSARNAGIRVILLESAGRLCARSVPPIFSDILFKKHSDNGVHIFLNCEIYSFHSTDNGKKIIQSSSGTYIADSLVVGVGLEPHVELAQDCGLVVGNGIHVDENGVTSDPTIYAVGDVASFPHYASATNLRIESFSNASNSALRVADHIMKIAPGKARIPWFWSDQLDCNIQILGIFSGNEKWIIRGDPNSNEVCLFGIRDDKLTSVISVNMGKYINIARRWMQSGFYPSDDILSNANFDLQNASVSF